MDKNKEKEELQRSIAEIMRDPAQRHSLAEFIVEYIEPNHIPTTLMSALLDTRVLNPGDLLVKKIVKGIKVHTMVPGQIPLKHEVTVSERANYVEDYAVTGVNVSEWDLKNGDVGTVESLRIRMQQAISDYFMTKVFTALSTIWTEANTPDNYTDCGGSVTATALEDMIDYINLHTPGAKAIVGTKAAITPITKFAAWTNDGTHYDASQDVINEIHRTGRVGMYYGVPLVEIPNPKNDPESNSFLVPSDKILIIGEKVGEFVTMGSPEYSQYTDPKPIPAMFVMQMMYRFGMIIDNAEGIGVLKVS